MTIKGLNKEEFIQAVEKDKIFWIEPKETFIWSNETDFVDMVASKKALAFQFKVEKSKIILVSIDNLPPVRNNLPEEKIKKETKISNVVSIIQTIQFKQKLLSIAKEKIYGYLF